MNNTGNGLVTVTQIMYVGATTDPNCVAVGASNCTNTGKFVFTQQVVFGNGTLANASTQGLGHAERCDSNQRRNRAESGNRFARPVTDPRPSGECRVFGRPPTMARCR